MQYPFLHFNDPWPKEGPIVTVPVSRAGSAVHMNYLNDQLVAARFLEAVRANPDDAWAFVSKMYVGGLDLNALREMLWPDAYLCRWVHKATYGNDGSSGHFMTRSLYVADPERDLRRLVHLRMVKEPDKYGLWKICGVEQEDCPRGV